MNKRNESYQRLDTFILPKNSRGRPAWFVQLWWLVQSTIFAMSPQFLYGWRRFILRLFGAKVGKGVLIRPSVKITYPWNVSFDEFAWIGDEVVLYSLSKITIGNHAVISQRSYICTGLHDYTKSSFDTILKNVVIESGVWLATDVFVAPGVKIKEGCLVGARSSVFSDLPPNMICIGNPAKAIKKRT
jgi:putative colanic acid biosynthesis acetyltransferase WcaF